MDKTKCKFCGIEFKRGAYEAGNNYCSESCYWFQGSGLKMPDATFPRDGLEETYWKEYRGMPEFRTAVIRKHRAEVAKNNPSFFKELYGG